MRKPTTLGWITLLLIAMALGVIVCAVIGCASSTAPPTAEPAPFLPVPTKRPAADQATAAAPIGTVPYAVIGQRYADSPDGTRHWFVTLQAATGEQWSVEVAKEVWARAAFEKRLCLSGKTAVVCP